MADAKKKAAECHKLLQDGYIYIDGEFDKGHYSSAVNIPAFSLPGPTPLQAEFLAGLAAAVPEKDKKMVVACASGKRSGMCMPWIVAAGYTNAVDMEGGWGAWTQANLPVE